MAVAICKNCSKEFKYDTRGRTGTYCSLDCSVESRRKERRLNFLAGNVVGRGHIKKHLIDIHGWQCVCCKGKTWQRQPIPLEVDHIDGNAGDNRPENLRLLCPNCHTQTPTHKAKNKGNGRGSRGLPWY